MTTPNITGLNAWGKGLPGGIPNAAEGENGDRMESFMSVMTKTANGAKVSTSEAKEAYETIRGTDELPQTGKNQIKPEQKSKDASKTVDKGRQNGQDGRDAKEVVRDDKTKTDKTDKNSETGKVSDKTKEAVEGRAEEIKVQIAQELDITVEELTEVMETLGLTATDLLNPQIVPQLVAEVTGTDISAVITDEGLYNEVNDILAVQRNTVADLMQDLDVTKEEFTELLKAVKEDVRPEGIPELKGMDALPEPDGVLPKTQPAGTKDFEKIIVSVEENVRDEVRTPAEADPELKNETGPTERKPVSEDLPTEGQSGTDSENVAARESRPHYEGSRQQGEGHPEREPETSFLQNLTRTVTENVTQNVNTGAENLADPYVQAKNLLDQIDSQIKVGFKQDTTSMEMQLNPASLGRINVRLEAVNGEITARFEAQNAQVRAALEGHVAELKQSLENQGVKIQSVEVTLASHEFEQNLMQGQDGNAQNANEGRRSGLRRINLNEDEDEEIEGIGLSDEGEAERIARSMMNANGQTVDFMA